MLDNDWEIFVMGTEFRPGQMERDMKDNEATTKLMALESFDTLTAIFTKGNGVTIKLMEKAHTDSPMELVTKANEKMTFSTDSEKKSEQTAANTKATIN